MTTHRTHGDMTYWPGPRTPRQVEMLTVREWWIRKYGRLTPAHGLTTGRTGETPEQFRRRIIRETHLWVIRSQR